MTYVGNYICISIEVFCFFGTIILNAVIYEMMYLRRRGIQPLKRGFFCNDETIKKPYMAEDLSFSGTLTSGILLSIAAITILEIGNHLSESKETKDTDSRDGKYVGSVHIPVYFIRMIHRMAIFGVGMMMVMLLCNCIAILSGRLRPHFLAVCKPNNTLYNCSDGYITADVCTGDPLQVKRARLSFPAIHTAASAYSLVFVAMCIQCLSCLRHNKILRLTLQGALVILVIATGLSRISRYYHHWTDIIGGVILGTIVARIVAVNILKLFAKTNDQVVYTSVPDEDEDDNKTSEKKPLVQ